MLVLQPLFSGSSGNAVLVGDREHTVLVDAGVSGKRICEAITNYRKTISSIDAIFITHDHIDHILSAGILSRRYHIPIFANAPTWEAMLPLIGDIPAAQRRIMGVGETVSIGEISAESFSIPHDAAEPVGYTFQKAGRKITIATDIGKMSEKLFLSLSGSDEILLESNYDIVMLLKGKYPPALKQRISSDRGHLSNKEAAACCARLASLGTKNIILGHLSKENNTPALALEVAKHYIEACGLVVGRDVRLSVAPRG